MRRRSVPSFRIRTATLVALAALLSWSAGTRPARAIELKRRFTAGVRLGDWLPADEQKGGFRFFGSQTGQPGENAVEIGEVPVAGISLGFGVAKWKRLQMSLELDASYVASDLGKETVYIDPDASVRIPLPEFGNQRGQSGDERFERIVLGDVTLTPLFVNSLFHLAGKGDPERADFYFGGGVGIVLAKMDESDEYRTLAADTDGTDDVQADAAAAVDVKAGANIRLGKGGSWFLFFEGQFYSTGLLSSDSQVKWSGLDYLACTQDIDTDNDGLEDTTVGGCYRSIDPGKVRMDGAIGAIGLRYRFGRAAKPEAAESAPEVEAEVAPEPAPEPVTPDETTTPGSGP
jgi:hypothetical protein